MGKTYLTHYLSDVMVCVGPEVFVVRLEITRRPALGTMRLIARKMVYVRCVGQCLRSQPGRKRLTFPIILTVSVNSM